MIRFVATDREIYSRARYIQGLETDVEDGIRTRRRKVLKVQRQTSQWADSWKGGGVSMAFRYRCSGGSGPKLLLLTSIR